VIFTHAVYTHMFILKVSHKDDTRRVALDTLTFATLSELVTNMFGFEAQPLLSYVDDEDDKVNITSDVELREALLLCQKQELPILHLFAEGTVINNVSGDSKDSIAESELETLTYFYQQLENLLSVTVQHCSRDVERVVEQCESLCSKMVNIYEKHMQPASVTCREQLAKLKALSVPQSVKLEERWEEIRTTILSALSAFRSWINSRIGSNSSASLDENLPETDAFPAEAVVTDELPSETEISDLPSDAAMKDLETLYDMGFTDLHRNIQLLNTHKGDLTRVINTLLG